MERVAGAALWDSELQMLVQERARCGQLRARLRQLETEREHVESALRAASDVPQHDLYAWLRSWFGRGTRNECSEAELEAGLARLRTIEAERDQVKAALAARADLDQLFTTALARKHAALDASAPGHAICHEIASALASYAEAQRASNAAQVRLHLAKHARDQLSLLIQALDNEDVRDRIRDMGPKTGRSKPSSAFLRAWRLQSEYEEAERTARALQLLHENMRATAEHVPGAESGLSELETALLEVLAAACVDTYFGGDLMGWLSAARRCDAHVGELLAAIHAQCRALDQLSDDHMQRYQRLVLQA